jgi:RHS repeat-associated protein
VVDDAGAIVKFCDPNCASPTASYLITWNGHGDALGAWKIDPSTGGLTLANNYTYSSWGAPTTATHNSIADLGLRFLYVGRYDVQWDNFSGLGLAYMHARHYAPAIGRFLQPDPTALEWNHYSYSSNNPVTVIDPSGTHGTSEGGCGYSWCIRWGGNTGGPGLLEGMMNGLRSLFSSGASRMRMTGMLPRPTSFPSIKPGASGGPTAGRRFPPTITRQFPKAGVCVYCRTTVGDIQVDHAIPRSRNGNATMANAQGACRWCNQSKGNGQFPRSPPPGYRGPWPPPWWDRKSGW